MEFSVNLTPEVRPALNRLQLLMVDSIPAEMSYRLPS